MASEQGYSAEAAFAMLMFSLASSSLLLINKLCLHHFPTPAYISTLQFLTASITSVILMATGLVATDHFEWRKLKPYLVYVCMFVATIYANMRALQHSNVETIIVFRACCPLVVCVLDWAFLGRKLPSLRSMCALLVVAAGCAGYVLTDRAFKLNGWGAYTWVSAYFVIISFEMAYGKHIVGPHLSFASMWGPTLYTNTVSVPPMLTIGLLTHENEKLLRADWSAGAIALLVLSCAVGVAISYLGWRARSLVTATCYTVLGVANKMLTVLANAMVWDQRASPIGISFLCVCLVGAAGYKQAPMAEPADSASTVKGNGRSRGRSTLFVILLVVVGAGVGTLARMNASPQPPSLAPLVPPSAAPYTVAQALPSAGKPKAASQGHGNSAAKAAYGHTRHAHNHTKLHGGRKAGNHPSPPTSHTKG